MRGDRASASAGRGTSPKGWARASEPGAKRPAQRASRPTAVAAIDCGTNTIKLLVGDPADESRVVRESRMVRLGRGVDRTGRLAPDALERAFAAIDDYAEIIRASGVERIRFCATSATRDSENSAEFAAGVRARLGIDPEVLTGEEEARLAFSGAVRFLAPTLTDPVLVVDIGGGSTELILGSAPVPEGLRSGEQPGGPRSAYSMDIGSVRLHERRVEHDPPTPDEVAAVVADVEAALDACPVDPAEAASVVGVAGTITTVAAAVLGLDVYDRTRIDGQRLAVADVHRAVADLVAMTVDQRRALGYMHPGRADVIDAGALVLDRVLRRTTLDTLVVAETDILDGIAWSLVDA